MNQSLTKSFLGLLPLIIIPFVGGKAQPTNNPYRSFYPSVSSSHWTEVLKWDNIFNVTSFGANGNDQISDQSAVEQAINAASNAGGGVVFFPPGTYVFTENLRLKSGVVLRGETPTVAKATDTNFRPTSKLEFPAYVFDTTANGGRGNANSTAFKIIGGIGSFRNVGVVNLDVNRARIEMHPNFDSLGIVVHPGAPNGSVNYQMREQNRNCIVMGVRSNNAAMPDPNLPDTSGPAKMRKWQRAPYRFASNFDLYFAENVVIANNRLNDAPSDNFDQPGYRVRNRCSACSNYKSIGQPNNSVWNAENFIPVISGSHARFRYQDHYGITLNRHKKVIVNGRQTIQQYIWYPEPTQEPSLYAKGFSILDNWVYKTNRVGLWVAGQGMEIRRNVIRDSATVGTSATPKSVWLTPGFNEINRNFSATYENRGIDFGGSDITIDSNDIQMRTYYFPESGQYGSIDGEGIMDQGNGGGTRPNGIYITNNILDGDRDDCTNPTIGLYRTNEIYNIRFANNSFTGNSGCMMMDADGTNSPKIMANVLAENNSGIKTLLMRGSLGGYNAIARNNQGIPGGGQLRLSCYVQSINNQSLTLQNGSCIANTSLSVDSSTFPKIKMATPFRDTLLPAPVVGFPLLVEIVSGSLDSIVFYQDSYRRIGVAQLAGDVAFLNWETPLTDGQYFVMAIGYFKVGSSIVKTKTALVAIKIDDGNPLTNNPEDQLVSSNPVLSKPKSQIFVYPNPTTSQVAIQVPNEEKIDQVEAIDVNGRTQKLISEVGSVWYQTNTLKAGIYSVILTTKTGIYFSRLVKK